VDEQAMLKRLLGTQWLAIGFVGGVSFVLSVFIARRFGAEIFGVYVQAISLGAFLLILIDGGFGKLLMREAVRASSALAIHGADLHGFAFGHACMAMALLALLAVMNPFSLHWPTLLATVGAFGVTVLGQFSMAILRGQGRLVHDALWQMVSRVLTAACMAIALWWGVNAPWEVLMAQLLGAVLFLLLLMRGGWVLPVFRVPRKIYAVVVPLIWLDLATVIYFRSDILLFKLMDVPRADVGAYGVAFRLIEAFLLLASPVSLLLFRRFRLDMDTLGQTNLLRVGHLAVLAGGVGLLIFLLALPTGDVFFRLIFGEEFTTAGSLFKVLCLMLIFALANGVLGQGVFALGLDRQYVWTATVAAVFNVGGNLLLMSAYGVWAAAWMTVATEMVLGIGLSAALFAAWKKMRPMDQAG
jgi:O-antigen/teichoic acid export membrane protein